MGMSGAAGTGSTTPTGDMTTGSSRFSSTGMPGANPSDTLGATGNTRY